MVSRKKILALVVVVTAVVAIAAVFLWQLMSASFAEVETAITSYINAVNNYDADASWELMSPDLQLSYTSKENFNSSILDGLKQTSWQASLASISSKSVEINNGVTTAHFIVTLQINETGYSPWHENYTFDLIKIGNQWKIDNWRTGEWD